MVRIAVIGAGHLGRFHAKLARELEGVELVGIADPVEKARRDVAAECNTAAVADFRELIGKIDAAIVATPTRTHLAVGSELLRGGVHVLMEKPLAVTAAECDQLVRLADDHGCVLQVGHIERFNPALDKALPYLRQPKYVEATRYGGYTFRSIDIGVVLDLMIHDLDVAMSLVGAPVADVSAFGVSIVGRHEDVARARLQFANGAIADLSASRVSYKSQRQMQIWSAGGHVNIDFGTRSAIVAQPAEILLNGSFDPEAILPEERARLKENFFEELVPLRRIEADATNALADEQRDFLTAIRSGCEPRVTGRQGREVVAVAERILASIAGHRWEGELREVLPDAISHGHGQQRLDSGPEILPGPHWHQPAADVPQAAKRSA